VNEVLKCDENLPNVNKTKHPKKGGKRYKMEAPKSKHKRKNHHQKWIARGEMNKSSIQPSSPFQPQVTRSISNKEKRGILNKTFNLEKFSLIVTTFLEIKIVYTCCSATNTFCL